MSRFSRARNVKDPVEALTSRGDCPCMKKVKPPIAVEGCLEQKITSLSDPGFETTTNPIPAWSSGGDSDLWTPYLQDSPGANPDRGWDISSVNPRSGTDHVRMPWINSVHDGLSPGDYLYPAEVPWCDNPAYSWAWLSRADPGEIYEIGLWAMASTTVGDLHLFMDMWASDDAGSFVAPQSTTDVDLTTTYTQYSVSLVIPSGAKYVTIALGVGSGDKLNVPDPFSVDVDDLTLSVT